MLLVRIETPESPYTRHAGELQLLHHQVDILPGIERVGIDEEMILAACMGQAALAGKAGTLAHLVEEGHAQSLVHLFRGVLRVVVHAQNLNGIFRFQLAQRPKAGSQAALLVIGNHHHRHQRVIALQPLQVTPYFLHHRRRHFAERPAIYFQIFVVPRHSPLHQSFPFA